MPKYAKGRRITWSWFKGRLLVGDGSGEYPGHPKLHSHNGAPVSGALFDRIPRGRLTITGERAWVEVVNPGNGNDHLPNEAAAALVKLSEVDEANIVWTEPGWAERFNDGPQKVA